MKIKPIGTRIQLEIDEPKAGVLDLSGLQTAIEVGKVVGKGKDVSMQVEIGDQVFFKAWSVDIIVHKGKKYFFIEESTKGI
jgi:co-chaperonin GroES (HSP10)